MTKRAKRIGWTIGVIVGITIALWVTWLPVLSAVMVKFAASHFRDNFQPSKEEMVACIAEDECAIPFAGTKGLPEIERLSRDPSLIPSGRETASNLFVHISTGGHLPYVRGILAHGTLSWLERQYDYYLLKNDTKYLKRKGLPIPEEMHDNGQ